MKNKIVFALTFVLVLFTCVSCRKAELPSDNNTNNNPQQLQILKTDLKLTQDQVLSQIKANHLKENQGYVDSDEIVTLITLPSDSLIDTYNEEAYSGYSSIAEYATSEPGIKQNKQIKKEQDQLIRELFASNLIIDVEYQYSTIINAIAIKTTYGKFNKIGKVEGVESTIISDTYNLPKSSKADASVINNNVEVYPTGIFDSSSVSYTGEGTAVAVLDSGFDCSHTVFQNQPNNPMISPSDITNILSSTNAASFTKNLKLSDVYYSTKIPYAYDYADKDSDVFPYDSEHGTHVAGIIGGKDKTITGVAINTQLVLLKVFPDLDEGASTEDILAALEDAVLIGVDAINMSLGSSCGFAREEDGSKINEVYDKINESGISLITAASNDYSAGYGGEQGNTNKVTNPDSGTVGSPSTYAAALSVASISGVKSKYLVGNDSQIVFFTESNNIAGDENDFFAELGITDGTSKTFEYVTIPGVGKSINYSGLDVKGKIALVRRGDNTFEEKALNAKVAGAVACIIYNNVEGQIVMSMGKTDHIPTISISKENGLKLAEKANGTLTISSTNQAGPFMSDFSSWGPTPSLGLKPEITAHGGNILSSIPGGGYDELSGTSMATPNLCGIIILIRQYLKELYPSYSWKEISVLANQLIMSTASIVLNQEGNPYSPRKQGAGLASLYNSVNTKGYITVDGIDRTKIELLDDPKRKGVYEMNFNVVNASKDKLTYELSVVGMTESVSTSDDKYVAEKSQLLSGVPTFDLVEGGLIEGNTLVVEGGKTAKVKVIYTLSEEDKNIINSSFQYGMYVEGFIKLKALEAGNNEDDVLVDLSIPFLAFYGDWTEAPMFDKTYYEVESEAHNAAIDDEDKLKADYYATTPYGSYYYNYIIPLGTYLYDIDTTKYDAIPASIDHIALSDYLGSIDGISAVYAGMLRNAKTVDFTITDKVTGEVIWQHIDYNALKAHAQNGSPIPYFEFLKLKSLQLGLVNNREYSFVMKANLDYKDGGNAKNVRNTFEFDFVLDNEAPILKDVSYEKVYDTNLKKDRYYITMVVYDNHYVQSITPIIFNSSSSYTFLTENPIPVYSEKGTDNKIRFEITDYLDDVYEDALCSNALGFSIDDYALNSNIYLCQLPGTRGDFLFTKDGTLDGQEMTILTVNEGDVVDLTKYLVSTDKTLDDDKSYLNHLNWSLSNESIAEVREGILVAKQSGRTIVTVEEAFYLKKATLIISIKAKPKNVKRLAQSIDDSKVESLRFTYFNTLFAYSRAAQTSEIGSTGSRTFISSLSSTLSFYPGEKIQLFYDINPWYVDDKYEKTYESTNPNVATVDEFGVVTGLKKGSTTITLKLKGSNIMARVRISIKSEFVIENRMLVAYKGLGGNVVIPDDEGILYIGAYAFCLYDTDQQVELTDEDYDANKIPNANTTIKSVVIPYGVTEIQKYAFYNCSGLEKVELPSSVKTIREYAFAKDVSLTTINLSEINIIGKECFRGCEKLNNIDLSKTYTIGVSAFEGCSSLTKVDLRPLRNAGERAFKDCTSLTEVLLSEHTKLSYKMFSNAGIKEIDIYETLQIPDFCFEKCSNLKNVTIHNPILSIGAGAFSECENLIKINILENVDIISEQAFYGCKNLETFTLPNCKVTLGNYVFRDCEKLITIEFGENTELEEVVGSTFENTSLKSFVISANNALYSTDGEMLLNKNGTIIIFASPCKAYEDYVVNNNIVEIANGAFTGCDIQSITFNNPIKIGRYAFANCAELKEINFPSVEGTLICENAFAHTLQLEKITNLELVKEVKDYAFRNTNIEEVSIGSNATYGEGVFFQSKLKVASIGSNTTFGLGAFQDCSYLSIVNMPEEGNVSFGRACFAHDILLSKIDLSKVSDTIELEAFYGCTSLRSANLENVKTIGDYAFADCSSLSYVNIPIVESIGDGAFGLYDKEGSGAPLITSITLPQTLTHLGDGVFIGCEGLQQVTFLSQIEKLSDYTFAFCVNLTEVSLNQNISSIGQFCFAGCESLSIVNLNNVEYFDNYAFTSCYSLDEINLASAKTIGIGTFADCKGLSSVGDTANLKEIDEYAFQASAIKEINALNVEIINDFAFQANSKLETFTFGKNIKHIGIGVFNEAVLIEKFQYNDGNGLIDNAEINGYIKLINGLIYTILPNGNLSLNSIPCNYTSSTVTIEEGTVSIEGYAGNESKNITYLILPDTLKIIGNYAFYGYNNLETVEFRSFAAPILENEYDKDSKITETDPGYDILHNQFDIAGVELCYYTFIDLVGKKKPIKMVLPSNPDITGYDSIVYQVYFGKVEDAKRSDYEAMHSSMINFMKYAEKVESLTIVNLNHESLINQAIASLNMVKQDPTVYGIEMSRWNELVEIVNNAKQTVRKLKLSLSSQELQQFDIILGQLPTEFKLEDLAQLKEIASKLSSLSRADRALLDLTNYNKLLESYNKYLASVNNEAEPIVNSVNKSLVCTAIVTSVLALASVMFISSKKENL